MRKGLGSTDRVGPQDIRLADHQPQLDPRTFMVQVAEAGRERNSTCPRSHSKWLIELNANGTHLGSVCVCVYERESE